MHNLTTVGPFEHEYKVFTNDPRHPVIKLTILATVKPAPEFVKRLNSPPLAGGDQVGDFKLWPTAYPVIRAERGERLSFAIRIRHVEGSAASLELVSKPSDKLDYKLRPDAGGGYWLDIDFKQVNHTGLATESIALKSGGTPSANLNLTVTVDVPALNLVVTPAAINFGTIAMADLKASAGKSGRVGIRKLVGSFQIKSVTSTLEFVQAQTQEMVKGSNYVIRCTINPDKVSKPGTFDGLLRVETDDREKPQIEIPIKVTLIER